MSAGSGEAAEPITIRRLGSNDDYAACVRLQRLVWGEMFTELVPLAILKVGQRIGGVTAGAFSPDGRLAGFVFGLTGVERGRLVHWSDMLAVHPDLRNRGIGGRLKSYQRAELSQIGVEAIYWTFDPLVARNAHLNLNRLGAVVREYVIDMYGADTSSPLQSGLGTDRLVIEWWIADSAEAAAPPRDGGERAGALVKAEAGEPALHEGTLAGLPPRLSIEVPGDIEAVQRESVARAARWRAVTRAAFTSALGRGYRVAGFRRSRGRTAGVYLLDRTGG
ncbi:MAG: hypothetical protein WD737_07825 [Gemmatimonadota bacterium]